MSYVLKIVVPSVPPYNHDAYGFADKLTRDSKGLAPAPRLVQFHDAITERFPCASSGAYNHADDGVVCPWGEPVLMACFEGDIGILTVAARPIEVIPFLLRRAGALALTVIDEQAGKVHRPATFCLTLDSIQKNVDINAVVAKLIPLLKLEREQVLEILATPRSVVRRRLDHVTAQRFAKTLDLVGCNCTVEKETQDGYTIPISGPGVLAQQLADLSKSDPDDDEFDSTDADDPPPPPSLIARVAGAIWQRLTRSHVQQW